LRKERGEGLKIGMKENELSEDMAEDMAPIQDYYHQ
jgi:hypothetical protein